MSFKVIARNVNIAPKQTQITRITNLQTSSHPDTEEEM